MSEPRPYVRSDWVDEVIDGVGDVSYALKDSLGILQLYFFKAQLDVLDGFRLATQRYVDFLDCRYGERDAPTSPAGETSSGHPARSTPRRQRERLWPAAESSTSVPNGGGPSDAEPSDDGTDASTPVVFRPVEPEPPDG